ncbi:hypothetical protein SY85_07795 [Flavisolibacter tropicus]|uniref:Uncharacterized protein n=1 Tax=Flavisolibacter tropicus TaxID=1492898 RepID=A0A172TTH8_9BACT|nr:hypothetical protein SY85_07795 [Flavisolibacter tropicus]
MQHNGLLSVKNSLKISQYAVTGSIYNDEWRNSFNNYRDISLFLGVFLCVAFVGVKGAGLVSSLLGKL